MRPPVVEEYRQYLEFADALGSCTVAPELEGAEAFSRAVRAKGIPMNAGHTWATLEQMRDSLLQSADRAELMVYVGDMLRELEIITKK